MRSGRGDADVGGNQRLLERLEGLDVDRPAPLLGRVRAPNDLVEPLDELLLRPRERLLDAIEKTHGLSVGLGPLFTSHEDVDGLGRRAAAVEHGRHLGRDRQFDAMTGAERQRRAGRAYAFGDHAHAAEDLLERAAAAELEADVPVAAEIAGRGQDEVAEAAQSGQRLAPAAFGVREPRNLDQPARDERGHGVVPKPSPSTTPDAIAITFFIAPPISTPGTSSLT